MVNSRAAPCAAGFSVKTDMPATSRPPATHDATTVRGAMLIIGPPGVAGPQPGFSAEVEVNDKTRERRLWFAAPYRTYRRPSAFSVAFAWLSSGERRAFRLSRILPE